MSVVWIGRNQTGCLMKGKQSIFLFNICYVALDEWLMTESSRTWHQICLLWKSKVIRLIRPVLASFLEWWSVQKKSNLLRCGLWRKVHQHVSQTTSGVFKWNDRMCQIWIDYWLNNTSLTAIFFYDFLFNIYLFYIFDRKGIECYRREYIVYLNRSFKINI